MKQIIRLAWSYLKYYRKQTMALFLGIVLSCALFTGIGSLQKSGNHAARENARTKSGDWHYTMRCDTDWFEEFEKTYQPGEKEQGYCVEKTGVLTMRKVTEEPYEIELDYAEEGYLSMMGRTVKEAGIRKRKEKRRWMNLHFGIWIFCVRSARHLHWMEKHLRCAELCQSSLPLLRSGCRYL